MHTNKIIKSALFLFCLWMNATAVLGVSKKKQEETRTLEMRFLTSHAEANGETDFHGETEWLDLDGRLDFLNHYADFASSFWGNPALDEPLLSSEEIDTCLAAIKPQPLTNIRKTLVLDEWKACGYRKGKKAEQDARWKKLTEQGAHIANGYMALNKGKVTFHLDSLNWRFRLKVTLDKQPSDLAFSFSENGKERMNVRFTKEHIFLASEQEKKEMKTSGANQVELYGDLENHRFFVTSGENRVECSMGETKRLDVLSLMAGDEEERLGALSLFSFLRDAENIYTPYHSCLLLNEDFEPVPSIQRWTEADYDDTGWTATRLPSVHGGLQEAGEDYFLRKKVKVDQFSRAYLDIETISPCGEVWVNGNPVAVVNNPHPQYLDITDYLCAGQENIIAVRVKPYQLKFRMGHTPSDPHIGWFLGRTRLLLTPECHIRQAFVYTARLKQDEAQQYNQLVLNNNTPYSVKGKVEVNYYPWFPNEGERVASVQSDVELRPRQDNIVPLTLALNQPEIWRTSSPRLYRVEVILKDENGTPIDDYALTTGIRTIRQEKGDLFINGQPEMLDGAQIMGFRPPVETISKTVKCPSNETVMRELLMLKKMGANLLRMHVHAEKDITEGTNDPRYAEYADQMGIYLLWQTAAWLREGEVWNIDFEGYPKFMRQVFNHPSIVMWEASNHPNRFKQHDFTDSRDFIRKIYPTIAQVDSSRLISPTSFWSHMHFGNYDGTEDYQGNPIEQEPLLMTPLMTRGSQDAYTGYGNPWSSLRNGPFDWASKCLGHDKCYFNFEHEESAAQPNWELARMEPWYEVQSYEWGYEEGSIGRKLQTSEWRQSQAFQAFSAWESMKRQILLGYDGFSWCTLESGPNMMTYQKPLIDPFGVPKLAYYANRQAFRRLWAASDDVDVVYGPDDTIRPVIFNLDEACHVDLCITLVDEKGGTIEKKVFRNVQVAQGRSITRLPSFRFRSRKEGCYAILYSLSKTGK